MFKFIISVALLKPPTWRYPKFGLQH